MKITRRQLRRIIRESIETDDYNAAAWEGWIIEQGGTPDDLDELARIFGAPDRNWLGPKVMGHGPVSLEAALDALGLDPPFRGPDPATHRRLRQQTRAQGGYSGRGAWKSRTPNE